MKHLFLFPALFFVIAMVSCGPAAENREQMMRSSKQFQDSIAKMLRTSIDEAAQPGPNAQMAMPAPATTTAAATPTAPAK